MSPLRCIIQIAFWIAINVSRRAHPGEQCCTGTSHTTTCSTAGEMSAGSCCSSISHSPCGSSCQERPRYLDIKPVYVRDVSHEQGNVYREHVTRVSGHVDDSSCSSQPDNVHQQLLNILNSASKLPAASPLSSKRLDTYSFEHSYDNQSSDESTADDSYKG